MWCVLLLMCVGAVVAEPTLCEKTRCNPEALECTRTGDCTAYLECGKTCPEGGPHPPQEPCKPLADYQPEYVKKDYNISKHMGLWYEVAFRDLYPAAPLCYCQHSVKKLINDSYIHDDFNFMCGPNGIDSYINPQYEKVMGTAIFDMGVIKSAQKWLEKFIWLSSVVGFKDDGKSQYAWVIEYQCGTKPPLNDFKAGGVLVQLFSRDLDKKKENYIEMKKQLTELNLEWLMDENWGTGFYNDTDAPWCKYPPAP